MTHKEVEIIQKLGCSSFTIYSYVKEFSRSSNLDLETNLSVSFPTIKKSLQKLEDHNIIQRVIKNNNMREIVVKDEREWNLN